VGFGFGSSKYSLGGVMGSRSSWPFQRGLEVQWLAVATVFLVQFRPEVWVLVWLAAEVLGFYMDLVSERFADDSY
jgi:hypothetical protein